MKKIIILICILSIIAVTFAGCGNKDTLDTPIQLDDKVKSRYARINIKDFGSITLKIYTEQEKDIGNRFLELCKNGRFNNRPLLDVIDNYVILFNTDDSNDTQAAFSGDYTVLFPIRGALCVSADEENKCNLNSIYLINSDTENINRIESLLDYKGYTLTDYINFGYDTQLTEKEIDFYRENGGAPWLQGHTVVFGQVTEGFDIMDSIIETSKTDKNIQIIVDTIETD